MSVDGSNALYKTKFKIQNSSFSKSISYNGGGLYIADYLGSAWSYMNNTKFTENECFEKGAGLYIRDGYFALSDLIFEKNQAYGDFSDPINPVYG